ncbi:MAG: ATP-binding cassette domain-containing protein [Cyanobacteria bacterium SIG28]|nr:ATP-binding cassette domain-containing protein [Cyanobacteria bacterium SIG28]
MSNKMNIVYTFSGEEIKMLMVSIQSVLENNKDSLITFYVATSDNNIDEKYLKILNNFEQYENCCKIEVIKIDKNKYYVLKPQIVNYHFSYVYELSEILNVDKFLYLNFFCIVKENIRNLYDSLGNYDLTLCEHVFNNLNQRLKNTVLSNLVMVVNSKKWKEKQYLKKFLSKNYLPQLDEDEVLYDCDCFNLIIENAKILDLKYNYCENWYLKDVKLQVASDVKSKYQKFKSHIETPAIITFIGPKPIGDEPCKNSYTSLWWSYAEKTPIYNEIKEYRQLNKYKLASTSAQNSFKYTWLLSRIYPYIKPYWFRILLGFAIAIPLGLLDGVTAFALKPYMDYVIGGKAFEYSYNGINISISSLQMAYVIPIGVILFAAVQGVLRYLNGYFSSWVSARITNDVKFDLFERLIHMHPQFFDDNSSGIVISRYMNDPTTASAGIVENIKTITTSLCGALGLIAVMLYSSWKLAFIGVLVLCIAFIPVFLIRKRLKDASNKNMVIGGKITTNINETYSGNKVMTAYGLQDRQNAYFQEQVWNSYHIGMALYKRAGWMSPMMYLIASCGIATVLGVGTYLINSGQMTAGAFASFVTSLLLLYKPVKTLGNTLTGIQNTFVAMGRVFELFDLTSAITDCENPKELNGLNNSITFENVMFEYVPNKPVLKNLNLNVKKNETLAVVGNSGGGKSTLVNLIPRFYDIKSGSLKFDGIDIKELSLKSLRQNISMVFQDNFLFTGTIKENIMMGKPDATAEELMTAIKAAHLEDMIAQLPDGVDTELGERGLTLSGGQRQRVAIARAMLRNAPIVILDEATSALDNESEAIVQKAMDNLMQNRTVFIIAHRLSTIKNADRIAVINEGELVELGSHDELMKIEHGQYKALYEMQFRKQDVLEGVGL